RQLLNITMKTGFIGLGAMGTHMARNLHRKGYLTAVWNRSQQKAETLAAETGCAVTDNPGALAKSCRVVVTCVSRDSDVLEVMDSIAPHIRPGTIVVDCSTTSADTARQAAARLAAADAAFLDCPVSGGTEGARDARLAIMVGGNADAFDRARPVLEAMGDHVVLMGDVGAGQATKACNQIMVAGINQAVTESLAFARAEGLDMDKLIGVLENGAAGNWFLKNRGPTMVRGDYPLGFKVILHEKDLGICHDMAERHSVQLPVVEMTLIHYRRLADEGHGDEDISALYRLKSRLFGIDVSNE
ncbi:MAG: NAD(P)-dependent oxidoreductase, partial [Gammaproteobacteria bacterium]